MRAFKVALIVFFSIIGIVGATVLGLYLTGKFEAPKIPPTDIYFADLSTNEAGENVFLAHEGGYETSNNFEMILSTSSADSTLNNVELGFLGVNNTLLRKYVKVNNETETPFCYTLDANSALVKYSLTSAEEATHVADPDGKVVVPKIVKLNKAFMVLTCVAPDDDFSGVIDETTPMYIKGGEVSLHAQSEHKLLSKIDTKINIDVPVSNITVLPRTDNGGDDSLLELVDGEYYLVNLESLFGLNIEFTPKRSAYLFGKDGSNGEAEYKKVLISLNNDETHFELINNDGIKVEGVSDILRLRSLVAGKGQINVRAYKNGTDCREFAGLTLQEQYDRLAEIGISKTVFVKVDEVGINGFEITTDYKEVGEELEFSVNNKLYLTANGLSDKYNSLGINILAEENYSAGLIQKEIANIYLSVEINGVDATAESNKYFEFVGSEVVTDAGKNYYKVIFNANVPNNSYWEIVALKETDLNVEIKVYYRNPDGTFASGGNFGPYSINGVVLSMVQAEVEWNVGDLITSDNAVANERNEVIIFFDESGNPIPVQYDIANFAKITNLNEKPAYTKIKYFALSKDTSLENKINCKKYEGKIEGVSLENDVCVYELLSIEKLDILSMDNISEYEFDLFFGVVLDHLGEAIVTDGGYQVLVLPTEDNGDLKTLPFRVSKTVGIDKIVADIVKEDLNGNGKLDNGEKDINNNGRIDNIKPYGGDSFYVLQNAEDSIEIAITINSDDEEIFKKQVQLGNIVLKAYCGDAEFSGLYYSKGGKIALQDALAVALENLNADDIETDEQNNTTIIKLRLSVDLIADFQETNENEKVVVIKLEYDVKNGKEESVDKIVLSTGDVRIYSGKIQNVSIEGIVKGETESIQSGSTIQINKKIEDGEFITEYILNRPNGTTGVVDLFNESDALKGLNIIVDGWGIDDSILVNSTNSAVLSVSTTTYGTKTAYCITPLKSGTAKLTITPNFKYSQFVTYEITFVIDAQFEIDDNDAEFRKQQVDGAENKDGSINPTRGILSYQENFGYTIIGAPIKADGDGYVIADYNADNNDNYFVYEFAFLVQLKAKKGDGEVNCKTLKFSINSNDADLEEYVDFVYEAGELVGFKVKQKFGRAGSFTVYYHSAELGYNAGVLKINIQPYWRAECELSDQLTADQIENVSNKIGNLIAGSKFVYAETAINLSTFKIYGYDLKKKVYNIPDGNFLLGTTLTPSAISESYAPLGSEIQFITKDGIAIASLKVDENNPYKPASIEFFALKEEKTYTLTLLNVADAGNKYNFAVDYAFVVCPNIKVGGDLTAGENGVYNLNTLYHNGNEISWSNENAIIKFDRLNGSSNFSSGNFLYKNYLVGEEVEEFTQGTGITISGVTKLSHYELVISYGGKEFKFRYYAEPNIVSFEGKSTVVYDKETYISLYAGMDVSGWANVDFGKLISNNSILTMKELDAFDGTEIFIDNEGYTAFDGSKLTINKNEHGLFEVYVVATGENNAYIVRKGIIFPANWVPYVKYFNEDGEEIGLTNADVKSILEGGLKSVITSGESCSEFATILTGNKYLYEIKDIKAGAVLDADNTLIKVENIAVGGVETPHIITYASGKDAEYEIAFTVDVQGCSYEFKYFVKVLKSQQIIINYPYHAESGNGDALLEDFDKSHIIYYDEFNSNNIYNIDLLSSKYNMFGRKYVDIATVGDRDAEHNKLNFKIYSLLVNGEVISESNFENYVKLNGSNVEINSSNTIAPMNITIEVSTENGAVEYYKILTQTRLDEYVLDNGDPNFDLTSETIVDGLESETDQNGELTGNKLYNLLNISLKQKSGDGSLSPVVDLTLNWAVFNEDGILQTENNLIYIAETKDADGKITSRKLVVKPYPNAIKATLCAFSENGIVAQIELDVPSPIKIEQIGATEIRADQQDIILINYLSILVDGTPVSVANINNINKVKIDFDLEGSSDIVSIKKVETKDVEGNVINVVYKLTILPHIGESFPIKINVFAYGKDVLPGTSSVDTEPEKAITANGTLSFTIKPNIVVNDNVISVNANKENFEYGVNNNLFTGGNSSYTYSVVDVTSTLEQQELNLYREKGATVDFTTDDFKNFIIGKFNTDTKTLKFKPLAVSANRTVVITFKISKGTFEATAKLTITIKPDCNVSPNYPDHGTGQVMDSHLVYYGDYLALTKTERKVAGNLTNTIEKKYWLGDLDVSKWKKALFLLPDGYYLNDNYDIVKKEGNILSAGLDSRTISIVVRDTERGETAAKEVGTITLKIVKKDGGTFVESDLDFPKAVIDLSSCLNITSTKRFTLDYTRESDKDLIFITNDYYNKVLIVGEVEQNQVVEIAVKVDGLIRATYRLEICASPIFSAKFTENGLNEYNEKLVAGELTDDNNHFGDGTSKIKFYFNESEIPFNVANTLFSVNGQNLDEFKITGAVIATFTLKDGGNQLAKYELTFVEDYNFNQNAFVSLPDNKEFEEYDKTTNKVSSTTIVLEAGTSYSLLELLSDNFGLTSYRGGNYLEKTKLTLIHGEYKTNNISFSELISLQAKSKTIDSKPLNYDYIITPNGAQNDGDIVHLVLRFGEETKTYIIRIEIKPNIEITVKGTGEKTIKYKNDGGNLKNVLLSELVNVKNVDISNLIVSVGDSAGSKYVNGAGSNRLDSWTSGEGESQTTVYGIKLKRTIFGGHIIKLTIGDRFGYKEELTIQYLNESGFSPQIIENPIEKYEFKDSIFEGDEFKILFKIGDKYYLDPQGTNEETLTTNSIIINNFGTGGNGINVSGLTFETSTTSKLGEITGNEIGYYNNEIFKTARTLLSDEFGFKIVLTVEYGGITETVELPVGIRLNQRRKVVPKSPYNRYSEIYLGVGNEYRYTDLFRIYDYKKEEEYSELSSGESYTPSATVVTFTNKVSESFEQKFAFTVNGMLHDYTFNIVLTPKYYAIETPADYYGNFGKVVDGESITSLGGLGAKFETWSGGFTLLDYYGNPIGSLTNSLTDFKNYSVSEGSGNISTATSTKNYLYNLSADSPITISVKSNNVEIGQVKVTMRQYDALNSSTVTAVPGDGETDLLNFAIWMNGIKARITGTIVFEDIPSGSSWFSFECKTSGYEIVTGEDGEYKLKKYDGNFSAGDLIKIKVSYLGKELGTITVTIA